MFLLSVPLWLFFYFTTKSHKGCHKGSQRVTSLSIDLLFQINEHFDSLDSKIGSYNTKENSQAFHETEDYFDIYLCAVPDYQESKEVEPGNTADCYK